MARLLKSGIKLEDFSKVDYVKRHANSLLAVYHGHVHAGATSFTARDKVDINFNEIKILWKSEPIYRGPWVAGKEMTDKDFNAIQKAMLTINQDENAQQIFEGLTTKDFIEGKDSDYDNVREVKKLIKIPE